ncbi:tetratricopeptide repeat protein [Hymenobacter koreensis]|uniref:Tetratricopeptide repeat protein n=1 Tax=Hymenobacter koreensis TaxID=1084523 RepID=A0ABP8JB64_9BACT
MIRILFLAVALSTGIWDSLVRVRNHNEAVQQAQMAFTQGNYGGAALLYEYALRLGKGSENIRLNLAHAYARLGREVRAREVYGSLLPSKNPYIRSVARQQLAVQAAAEGEYAQANALLKQALLDYPSNAAARYNYELLRRYLGKPNQPRIPPPAPKKPSNGQGGTEQPQQGTTARAPKPEAAPEKQTKGAASLQPGNDATQSAARGNEPGDVRGLGPDGGPDGGGTGRAGNDAATGADARVNTRRERLQQLDMSEAQARQLLDALRAQEQQYLQQLPHKATRRPEPGKPTW